MAQVLAGPWTGTPEEVDDAALATTDTLTRVALVLDAEAREHKRLEKRHRRSAQQCRQALEALRSDAAAVGYPIHLTPGEAR